MNIWNSKKTTNLLHTDSNCFFAEFGFCRIIVKENIQGCRSRGRGCGQLPPPPSFWETLMKRREHRPSEYQGLKDISTPDFSTPSFNPKTFNPWLFNLELFKPWLFNHEFLNHEVERSIQGWSLGLKSPGLRCRSTYQGYNFCLLPLRFWNLPTALPSLYRVSPIIFWSRSNKTPMPSILGREMASIKYQFDTFFSVETQRQAIASSLREPQLKY